MKRKKTTRAGRLVRTVIYTVPMSKDPPRERAARRKISSEAQARLNVRTSRDKLELLLAANFGKGDLWVTTTYDDDHLPPTRAEARKRFKKFVAALRKARRLRGQDLRYVYCIQEILDDGSQRLHHHMILNGCGPEDLETIRSLWTYGSNNDINIIDDDQAVTAIATYMCHEPIEHGKPRIGEQMWTPSKGLTRPETVTVDIPEDDITLQAPAGAVTIENDGRRTEYGEYAYLKYWLPEELSYRPAIWSGGRS